MLATRIHGVSPFKGYRVTCFTNEEEEAVGLAPRATWLLETELKEKVGTGRWLAMYLGLFGTYRKNETIDLQFQRGGKTELISDLSVEPD